MYSISIFYIFFFFNVPATTEIYTLSLHDALPISRPPLFARTPSPVTKLAPRTRSRGAPSMRRRGPLAFAADRKSTRLNSSHLGISYAVFCLKKKKNNQTLLRQRSVTKNQDIMHTQ